MTTAFTDTNTTNIAKGVSSILADTYTLYLKTQNYHWNVTGPRFPQLHEMFEKQYTEMAIAVDEIAERIRALGFKSPGSLEDFLKLTSLTEDKGHTEADEMIKKLVHDHTIIAEKSREVIRMADESNDEATADLLASRIKVHEKTAWMLKSVIQ